MKKARKALAMTALLFAAAGTTFANGGAQNQSGGGGGELGLVCRHARKSAGLLTETP
ncbi:MAG: hypothetical protein LBB22_02290 [Treponema sp.]|nr:hypothetical protein [Treponema sp.]